MLVNNMSELLLEMKEMCKAFPGVKALDNAKLELKKGSVHALMGENGAGKSTLMKCLFGVYREDSGSIKIEGKPVKFNNPKQALDNGVAMVHQELNQVLKRDIADNIWLGRYPSKFGIINRRKMHEDTERIFGELGINLDSHTKMSNLSVSQRQMVEIAKAVSYNAKIVVLDEPTSSLTDEEVERLFVIIEKLKAKGCGIIYISHKMEEILRICDEVTVMCDGRHISTKPSSELTIDEIIKLMVGREITSRFPEKTNKPKDAVLEIKNLESKYMPGVKDVSFYLKKGEILGIAGLVGSGRTELLETIFGMKKLKSGKIILNGKEIKNRYPKEAIENGFALLTEERRATGIFGGLDIKFNSVISSIDKYTDFCIVNNKKTEEATNWVVKNLRVKTPSNKTRIGTLSGGNQQKVVLGKWLLTGPEILMLDEPTRGIDVGAKFEIYQLITELANKDKGIIVVSSEMPELMGICDRIMVMSGGKSAGILKKEEFSQEKIMEMVAKFV